VGVDETSLFGANLIVEPSKLRLCIDARFLNRDMPFSLDKLADVLRYIYEAQTLGFST